MVDKKTILFALISLALSIPIFLLLAGGALVSIPLLILVGFFAFAYGIAFACINVLYIIFAFLNSISEKKEEKRGSGYSLKQSKEVK